MKRPVHTSEFAPVFVTILVPTFKVVRLYPASNYYNEHITTWKNENLQ